MIKRNWKNKNNKFNNNLIDRDKLINKIINNSYKILSRDFKMNRKRKKNFKNSNQLWSRKKNYQPIEMNRKIAKLKIQMRNSKSSIVR